VLRLPVALVLSLVAFVAAAEPICEFVWDGPASVVAPRVEPE
jgi:hypothetical protein